MDKKAVVALAYQEAIVARVVSPLKLQSNHPCFPGGMASFKKYYSNLKREESLKQSAKRWTLNRTWADRIL